MRLSIGKNDPGYRSDAEMLKFRVFFNGQERFDLHTADEEQGYVQVLQKRQPAPWLAPKFVAGPKLVGKVEIRSR